MSARIPETMLLSDLLKPTGYDCPEDLQGKTFEEAVAGNTNKTQTTKEISVDVSSYTEPITIDPDEDFKAMKKVVLTLTNIPEGN